MKATVSILLKFFSAIFLVGCSSGITAPIQTVQSDDVALAQDTLVTFLGYLHAGQYEEAVQLYGGTYEIMQDHNPGITPTNYALLMENACTINGAACLKVKSTGLERIASPTEFEFKVDLRDEDGVLCVFGWCIGGNTTDYPPQSGVLFTVIKNSDGKFLIMDMPPYTP